MWRLCSKIYFIGNSWKFYEVRSERGDFNSCGKWSSRVLPLMLWWSLAWFPYFYSDCPWPYCVSQMKNLDQWLTKRYLLSRKLLISCQGFKVVIKIRSELQRSSLLGHSTTTWTKFYPILTPYPSWVDILHGKYLPFVTWSSMDFLLTPPPFLVHVVIEWPLIGWTFYLSATFCLVIEYGNWPATTS